jgi:hypothetical protein
MMDETSNKPSNELAIKPPIKLPMEPNNIGINKSATTV